MKIYLFMIAIAVLILMMLGYFNNSSVQTLNATTTKQAECQSYYDATCDTAGSLVEHVHKYVK